MLFRREYFSLLLSFCDRKRKKEAPHLAPRAAPWTRGGGSFGDKRRQPFGADKPAGPVPGGRTGCPSKTSRWDVFESSRPSVRGSLSGWRKARSWSSPFRWRKRHSPIRRGPPFCPDRKGGKNGSREASLPAVGNVALKALWASIASASLRDRPALENPAPAHRRRTLRLGPRDRRLHWRRTVAPSKGGLHESQPAYPGHSIAAGGRWG